jgi:lysophospholipase L1-like esterase
MTDPGAPPSLSRGAAALGFFLGACLVGLILVFMLVFSPPAVLDTTEGAATIHLSANRSTVVLPGDCVQVQWEAGSIRSIRINDAPTVGAGEQEICITTEPDSMPTLRITLPDDSVHVYSLNIGIVVRNPLFWLLVVLAGVLLAAAISILLKPRLAQLFTPARPFASRTIRFVEKAVPVLLLLGVALEFGLRFYFTHFGTERERVMYIYTADDIERQSATVMPMPYVSYVASPDFDGHNRLGYRGADIEIPKPDGIFRIVSLGGSTTYSSSTSWEDAYPAQLQNILRDQYGYDNVEVVNGGVPGYTSWDVLANVVFRTRELEPDMLLIYDGINDIQPRAVDSECYRGLNALRGLSPTRGLWTPLEIESNSALYRVVAIQFGWMPDPSTLTGRFNLNFTCSGDLLDNERIPDNPPIYLENHWRDIITLAHANDIQVMFSTWTYDPHATTEAVPPTWAAAIDENNDIIRRLAVEFELPLYDLAATDFRDNDDYWADPIHLDAPGTHEQANRYAAYMDEQGLIPSP